MTTIADQASRRQLLRFLAASPLLPWLDLPDRWSAFLGSPTERFGELQTALDRPLLTSAKEAINVMDFEAVARQKLPPAHFGYLATGVDDDATIAANRAGYSRIKLRVRRLTDIRNPDLTITMLGSKWSSPILLCPLSSQKMFHPEGELAVARAAKDHLQVISTLTTTSLEELNATRAGQPVWFQLYARQTWPDTQRMVQRAEAAGCPALVWTVDLIGGSNRETLQRARRADTRQCSACHEGGNPSTDNRRRPMLADFPSKPAPDAERSAFSWDYLSRLKDSTSMKLFVKGLVTREDAELAVARGVDGIVVSNHGGRAEESLRPTIECLPEVVEGAAGKVPVILDGGIRRGTDIFKALALGANATGIGRPYIWGLASFGQEGVEVVLSLLREELQIVMRQAGAASIGKIGREHVIVST